MSTRPTTDQWRQAAIELRIHAAKFDALASDARPLICGVVLPNAAPGGYPVACAFNTEHDGVHSWAYLPTVTSP